MLFHIRMSKLLRHYSPGEVYFVTTVTHSRAPILVECFDMLWSSVERVSQKINCILLAWVVIPDHLHLIIDPRDSNLSSIMQQLKMTFAVHYLKHIGASSGKVWQTRFWDHAIRDQHDFNTHLDYIHYNPVKHGLTRAPIDWPYSSFNKYLITGQYSAQWGVQEQQMFDGSFGE
jgi:putative transposase